MAELSEHKLKLSDEVWEETRVRAVLEEKPAYEICAHVLTHYIELEEKPPIQLTSAPTKGSLHSVYLDKFTWAELIRCRVSEKRPISAILEQQLRAYLAMDFMS